ncbi:MAG: outer membrane beta-barrel protein [Prevotella sp.]|nr:outer membrane beta-barrel protein [Prevotella sp.]
MKRLLLSLLFSISLGTIISVAQTPADTLDYRVQQHLIDSLDSAFAEKYANLNEVRIIAKKPIFAIDGEKMLYNVSEDPMAQGGTAMDALQNAPGVLIDAEGNISLRGISSVEVWINNRPSHLDPQSLKTYLQTLPANSLERIETITNPSARYATKAEAVINIITSAGIKQNSLLYAGANVSSQPAAIPYIGYVYSNDRLTINTYASGYFHHDEVQSKRQALSRKDGVSGYEDVSEVSSAEHRKSRTDSYNAGVFVSYNFDTMTEGLLYGAVSMGVGNVLLDGFEHYVQYLPLLVDYSRFDTGSTRNWGRYGIYGAILTHKFDNNGHLLRITADGNLNTNSKFDYQDRVYLFPVEGLDDMHKYLRGSDHEYNNGIEARYTRPYGLAGELTCGVELTHLDASKNYSRYGWDAMHSYTLMDSLRTYDYRGSDTRLSADVGWTHRWAGLSVQVGLGSRYELVQFSYNGPLSAFSDEDKAHFLSLAPSLHLSYRTTSMHNFKLNYTLRTTTPDASQLSDFRIYSDDGYTAGNSSLQNSLTHSVEAGWSKFFTLGMVGVDGYARWSEHEISTLTEASEVEDIYLRHIIYYSTPYNMGQSHRIGGTAHLTLRPKPFLNIRFYGNIYEYGYRMDIQRADESSMALSHSMVSYDLNLNAWTKFMSRYQLFVSATYTSPTIGLASKTKTQFSVDCGFIAEFFDRHLSLFVNVKDLFGWGRYQGAGSENINPYYLVDATTKTLSSRYIGAGLMFRLGKLELESKAQGMGNGMQ